MTGNQLYSVALDLLGLRGEDENTPCDTDDLKARALTLINTLLAENAILDCKISKKEHSVSSISSLDEVIDMTDIVCSTVLPHGLARLLVLGEDDALASAFSTLYEKARLDALRFGRARILPISEVYK